MTACAQRGMLALPSARVGEVYQHRKPLREGPARASLPQHSTAMLFQALGTSRCQSGPKSCIVSHQHCEVAADTLGPFHSEGRAWCCTQKGRARAVSLERRLGDAGCGGSATVHCPLTAAGRSVSSGLQRPAMPGQNMPRSGSEGQSQLWRLVQAEHLNAGAELLQSE